MHREDPSSAEHPLLARLAIAARNARNKITQERRL